MRAVVGERRRPAVTAAGTESDDSVWVRMKRPEYVVNGLLYVDPRLLLRWRRLAVVPSAACGHIRTVCRECLPTWAEDWEIRQTQPDTA